MRSAILWTLLLTLLGVSAASPALQFASSCGQTCFNSCCHVSISLARVLSVSGGVCYAINGTWDGGASGFDGGSFRSFFVSQSTDGSAMSISWFSDASCTDLIVLGPSDPKGCTAGRCCNFMFERQQGGVWFETSITLNASDTYAYYGVDMGVATYGDCPNNAWIIPTVIAAAAVGGIAIIIIVIISIVCCCRRRNRAKHAEHHQSHHHQPPSPAGYTSPVIPTVLPSTVESSFTISAPNSRHSWPEITKRNQTKNVCQRVSLPSMTQRSATDPRTVFGTNMSSSIPPFPLTAPNTRSGQHFLRHHRGSPLPSLFPLFAPLTQESAGATHTTLQSRLFASPLLRFVSLSLFLSL